MPKILSQDVLWYFVNTRLLWCFAVFHFSFWPSFLFGILYLLLNAIVIAYLYKLTSDGTFFLNFLLNFIFAVVAMFFINICMKKLGQLHVLAEIRAGSEEVLDGLDQGVVIL